MDKLITFFTRLAFSQTAKDTYLVMIANVVSGFSGLVFTILVARFLSVGEFGTFSSLINLSLILASLVDLGMTQGAVNFIPSLIIEKKDEKIRHYIGNMTGVILLAGLIALIGLQLLPGSLVIKLGGTDNRLYLLITGLTVIAVSFYGYFIGVFQAFKKFLPLSLTEIIFTLSRIGFLGLLIFWGLTIDRALATIILGALVSFLIVWRFWPHRGIKFNFSLTTLKKIFKFSRWLWLVNMIINVYGKLDVLFLTALTTNLVVAKYAAATRLALVFPLTVNSLNAVIAPRFASFSDKQANLSYVKKSGILSLALAGGFLLWVVLAQPLVLMVYGWRYIESIGLFRGLVIANIPLLLTIPATNSLIYFFKKPNLITIVSAMQLGVFAVLNGILIPHLSAQAPIYAFLVANLLGLGLIYILWFKWQFLRNER